LQAKSSNRYCICTAGYAAWAGSAPLLFFRYPSPIFLFRQRKRRRGVWDERSMWEAAGKLLEFSALSIGVARGREGRWLFPRFWLPSLPFFSSIVYRFSSGFRRSHRRI